MKPLISSLVFAVLALSSTAQVVLKNQLELPSNYLMHTDHLYFNWVTLEENAEKPMFKKQLNVYNKDLQLLQSYYYDDIEKMGLRNPISGSDFSLIQISKSNTQVILVLDAKGTVQASKEFENGDDPKHPPMIQVAGPNIYLVNEIKDKQHGYSIECFDKKLNTKWTYTEMPEKGRNKLKEVLANDNGFTILHDYHKNALVLGKPYLMKIDNNGKQVFNKEIADLPTNFKIKQFELLKDGSSVLVGTYNSSQETRKGVKGDIYYVHFSSNGDVLKAVDVAKLDLSMVEIRPKNSVSFDKNKSTFSLEPLKIIERENGIELFCEAYIFSAVVVPETYKVSSTTYYSLDFYSILFKENETTIIQRAKNYSMFTITSGLLISFEGTQRGGSRSFRHEYNGVYYFWSLHNGYPYLGNIKANETYESVSERVYLTDEPLSDFWYQGNITCSTKTSGSHYYSFIWNESNYTI